jgi:hypothetical protein
MRISLGKSSKSVVERSSYPILPYYAFRRPLLPSYLRMGTESWSRPTGLQVDEALSEHREPYANGDNELSQHCYRDPGNL